MYASNEDEGKDETVLIGRRGGFTRDDTFDGLRDVADGAGGGTEGVAKTSLPLVEGTDF